jgi:hypothetical protein
MPDNQITMRYSYRIRIFKNIFLKLTSVDTAVAFISFEYYAKRITGCNRLGAPLKIPKKSKSIQPGGQFHSIFEVFLSNN